MRTTKYLKSGEIAEESIQKTVMDWVRLYPDIKNLVMHFPNEGKRSPRYGLTLKDMGMRPGVSDIHIAMMRHGFGAAWIELKAAHGIISPAQKQFLIDMEQQGYFTAVCYSIDETIAVIKWYCFDP